MTELKKLREEVKVLKREVKSLRALLAKVDSQLDRVGLVASTASSSASETKKKLSSLMRDPAIQVPDKLARKVEALNRAHANTRALAERTDEAVHTVNKEFREDTLKSLRGFEARLEQVESVAQSTSQLVDEAHAEQPVPRDANGTPVEEPVQMDLEDAIAKTGVDAGASP